MTLRTDYNITIDALSNFASDNKWLLLKEVHSSKEKTLSENLTATQIWVTPQGNLVRFAYAEHDCMVKAQEG